MSEEPVPYISDAAFTLAYAFPAGIRPQPAGLSRHWSPWLRPGRDLTCFPVTVNGETVFIPDRVDLWPGFWPHRSDESRGGQMRQCMMTRSSSGFERQAAVRRVATINRAWSAPFLVALAGDYVIEILDEVHATLPVMDGAVVGHFLRENPAFHHLTRDRVMSYWNAYYRADFRRADYVGFRLLDAFDAMAKD
jgi:hypothetical protein